MSIIFAFGAGVAFTLALVEAKDGNWTAFWKDLSACAVALAVALMGGPA